MTSQQATRIVVRAITGQTGGDGPADTAAATKRIKEGTGSDDDCQSVQTVTIGQYNGGDSSTVTATMLNAIWKAIVAACGDPAPQKPDPFGADTQVADIVSQILTA